MIIIIVVIIVVLCITYFLIRQKKGKQKKQDPIDIDAERRQKQREIEKQTQEELQRIQQLKDQQTAEQNRKQKELNDESMRLKDEEKKRLQEEINRQRDIDEQEIQRKIQEAKDKEIQQKRQLDEEAQRTKMEEKERQQQDQQKAQREKELQDKKASEELEQRRIAEEQKRSEKIQKQRELEKQEQIKKDKEIREKRIAKFKTDLSINEYIKGYTATIYSPGQGLDIKEFKLYAPDGTELKAYPSQYPSDGKVGKTLPSISGYVRLQLPNDTEIGRIYIDSQIGCLKNAKLIVTNTYGKVVYSQVFDAGLPTYNISPDPVKIIGPRINQWVQQNEQRIASAKVARKDNVIRQKQDLKLDILKKYRQLQVLGADSTELERVKTLLDNFVDDDIEHVNNMLDELYEQTVKINQTQRLNSNTIFKIIPKLKIEMNLSYDGDISQDMSYWQYDDGFIHSYYNPNLVLGFRPDGKLSLQARTNQRWEIEYNTLQTGDIVSQFKQGDKYMVTDTQPTLGSRVKANSTRIADVYWQIRTVNTSEIIGKLAMYIGKQFRLQTNISLGIVCLSVGKDNKIEVTSPTNDGDQLWTVTPTGLLRHIKSGQYLLNINTARYGPYDNGQLIAGNYAEIQKHYIGFRGANWKLTDKGQLQSYFAKDVNGGSVKVIKVNYLVMTQGTDFNQISVV